VFLLIFLNKFVIFISPHSQNLLSFVVKILLTISVYLLIFLNKFVIFIYFSSLAKSFSKYFFFKICFCLNKFVIFISPHSQNILSFVFKILFTISVYLLIFLNKFVIFIFFSSPKSFKFCFQNLIYNIRVFAYLLK